MSHSLQRSARQSANVPEHRGPHFGVSPADSSPETVPASVPASVPPGIPRICQPAAHFLREIGLITAWEWRCFFQRPSTYLLLLASTLTAGWSFSWLVTLLARGGGVALRRVDDPLVQYLGPNVFLVAICTLLVPLLTMNLVADERRRGTWELLLTSPVTAGQALIGKFLAGWTLFLVTLSPWPWFLLVLRFWNGGTRYLWDVVPWLDGTGVPFDPGPVCSGLIGLSLIIGTFVAIGLFWSSLCRRPVSAALLTFGTLTTLLLLSFVPRMLQIWGTAPEPWRWIETFSCWGHLERFSRGTISPRLVVGHLSTWSVLLWLSARLVHKVDEA